MKEGVNKTANTKEGEDFQLWFLKLNSILTSFKEAHFVKLFDMMPLEGLYLFWHEDVILVPQGILERLTREAMTFNCIRNK